MNSATKTLTSFLLGLLYLGSAGVALALTSNVTVNVTDPNQNPLKIQTLTLTPEGGGEPVVVENDDDDDEIAGLILEDDSKYEVAAQDEEGNKYKGILLVPSGAGPHRVTISLWEAAWWEQLSTPEKAVLIGLPLAAIGAAASDGDGGSGGGGQPSEPDDSEEGQPSTSNVPFSTGCNATFNPQNSAGFVFAEVLPNWLVSADTGSGSASIRLNNGVVMNGSFQNGQVNVSGTGSITGVQTTATFMGNLDFDAGQLSGTAHFGPPLGGGSDDEVIANCNGTIAGP